MATDQFTEIVTTRTANPEQLKPVVDESEIYMPLSYYRALNGYNIAKRNNRVKNIGDQKIKVLNQRRFEDRVTVTAAASAAAVSITVNTTAMIKKDWRLYDINTGQQIKVVAPPVAGSQTLTVDPLAAAISGQTVLAILGRTVGENWERSTPLSRTTSFHYDYVSLKQMSYQYSWHMKFRDAYVEKEAHRIPKQANEEFNIILNSELMFGTARDGTTTGEFQTGGLVEQGRSYNLIECPGVMTPDLLNYGIQLISNEGNATGMLEGIMAPTLKNKWATWPFGAGIVRFQQGQNTYGSKALPNIDTPVEGISGVKPSGDLCLQKGPGFDDIVVLVNWDGTMGTRFGEDYLQRNVQNLGSGSFMDQLTRSVGLEFPIPAGAVCLFTNVKSFAP